MRNYPTSQFQQIFNAYLNDQQQSFTMMRDDTFLLQFPDYFFTVVHITLILFNLFGWSWIWRPLRKPHLLVILLTFISWGILRIWYGQGYCPLTDWHWELLSRAGHRQLPHSYISYLLQRMLGWHLPDRRMDFMTVGLTFITLMASIRVNFFGIKRTE